MAEKAILYDATKCTGCRGCQVACKQWNDLPAETTTNRGTYENPPDLSESTWLKMRFIEEGSTASGDMAWLFSRYACMHCGDAACINVCPTQALYRHELGMVLYDRNLCSGCGYCVEACPFSVPRMEEGWNKLTGMGKVSQKCTMCVDRVTTESDLVSTGDRIPACVKSCPPGALQFGERRDMIVAAKARIADLEEQGKSATLYGESEVGGAHVMYILDRDPEEYGLPENPKVSVAVTSWKDILQPVGYAVAGLAAVGLGVNYLVARARMIQEKEGK